MNSVAKKKTESADEIENIQIYEKRSGFELVSNFALHSPLGRFILFALSAALVILINVIVSGDNFNLFYLLTGLEIFLGLLLFWIFFFIGYKKEREEFYIDGDEGEHRDNRY